MRRDDSARVANVIVACADDDDAANLAAMTAPATPPPKRRPVAGRILTWWFGAMSVVGVAFGMFADQRPFGDDVLEHPLVMMFLVVGIGLIVLRAALRRPVPEMIPDRLLLFGCFVGLAAFLIGNWLVVNLVAIR